MGNPYRTGAEVEAERRTLLGDVVAWLLRVRCCVLGHRLPGALPWARVVVDGGEYYEVGCRACGRKLLIPTYDAEARHVTRLLDD